MYRKLHSDSLIVSHHNLSSSCWRQETDNHVAKKHVETDHERRWAVRLEEQLQSRSTAVSLAAMQPAFMQPYWHGRAV